MLADELSLTDWRGLHSLIVTHYDADHWRGLEALAKKHVPPNIFTGRSLKIYSPAVPFGIDPDLPGQIMQLISMTSSSGVEALDLEKAWNTAGVSTELIPVADGDIVMVAGREHLVVWPPRELDEPITSRAADIVQRISDMAVRRPELGEALKRAYRPKQLHPVRRDEDDSLQRTSFDRETLGAVLLDLDDDLDDYLDDDEDDLPADEDEGHPVDQAQPALANLTAEEVKLVKEARALQNTLSLVLHDEDARTLLVYGDATESVLRAINGRLGCCYEVILAPHHGTHPLPGRDPVGQCIAQGGPKSYKDNWRNNHVPTHDLLYRSAHHYAYRLAHRYPSCMHVTDYPAGVSLPMSD